MLVSVNWRQTVTQGFETTFKFQSVMLMRRILILLSLLLLVTVGCKSSSVVRLNHRTEQEYQPEIPLKADRLSKTRRPEQTDDELHDQPDFGKPKTQQVSAEIPDADSESSAGPQNCPRYFS